MASAEQPLKKRRNYGPAAPEPPPPLPQLPQPPPPQIPATDQTSIAPSPSTPPQLSQAEILLRRRNRDEIRSVYECFKRIRFFLSQKEKGAPTPDIEQAYLSLITASRGCTSVKRIVADFIPRYAPHCPTALEAATRVIINMHNQSLEIINNGEDVDNVAFETARACIIGLVDICAAVMSKASTSSVIRGICFEVFQNAFTFFVSSFEGKDIFQIVDKEALRIQDSADVFTELKQKYTDENILPVIKLSKLRAISLLWIFFHYPKNLAAACFELFNMAAEGIHKDGQYFLNQIVLGLDVDITHHLDKRSENQTSPKDCKDDVKEQVSVSSHLSVDASSVSRNCMLSLVMGKDQSFRNWMFTQYKRLRDLPSFRALADVASALEGIFESFSELMNNEDTQINIDEEMSDSLKHSTRNRGEISMELSDKRRKLRHCDSLEDGFNNKVSGQHFSSIPLDCKHTSCSDFDAGSLRSMAFDVQEPGGLLHGSLPPSQDPLSKHDHLSYAKTSLDLQHNSFECTKHSIDGNQVSGVDRNFPAQRLSAGDINNDLVPPRHQQSVPCSSTTCQNLWFSDGDSSAMDIFSASKQLWVGLIGPEVSEGHIRYQFERFGYIGHFFFFPLKRFAVVEYGHIIDAIRAREYMRGQFQWCVKFMDIGLGTRGSTHGVAIGSSLHVYVGNVLSYWMKDEILHETRKALNKGPYMVSDLGNEGALLMEFETPEEAAVVMAHLRQHRREKNIHWTPPNAGQMNIAPPYLDGGRSACAPGGGNMRSNNPGNMPSSMIGSPHAPMVPESPNFRSRMSELSSLLYTLRAKYSINQNSSYFENYISGSCNTSMREEDRTPTSTLWVSFPNCNSPFVTDEELMKICNLAISNTGSVVRMTRASVQVGCGWFVECSSVDAAITILKNLRSCPGIFLRIEFSSPGRFHAAPFLRNHESCAMELPSPRILHENHAIPQQGGYSYQSNWAPSGQTEMLDIGVGKTDACEKNVLIDHPQGGHIVSGTIPCLPISTMGPPAPPPPPQIQPPPFVRSPYPPPNSSWDPRGLNHPLPLNPISPNVIPNTYPSNSVPCPPFLPASVTPLSQIQGTPMQHLDHVFPHSVAPPSISSLPPSQPEMPPPIPPSPPPLPHSQPPNIPPPPSSPPPPPPPLAATGASEVESCSQHVQYQWKGALCKSGVQYCSIYAQRVDSQACKYLNAGPEPIEWPAKLDMTKRTDFKHVKSTFTSTSPSKREICQLIPSSVGDHKGFQDFVSYLKQRDCAGVIKIPATKSLWTRLLFILPYSQDSCSLLSIPPGPPDSLIALVLPKETNFEWV
ncbi:hypothetical protein IC582_015459 [Cucumis melo]|nr:uncharacterized protein LOC127150329 [Cucumis melo]KAA0064439.1 uncharacterized protein E6C27_scaffold255G001510 [Cucumis melo var. makuwa]TYK20150.1 uncharacterized protein E5676_scaffold134G002770 [Cucumis melo var. makuwa]